MLCIADVKFSHQMRFLKISDIFRRIFFYFKVGEINDMHDGLEIFDNWSGKALECLLCISSQYDHTWKALKNKIDKVSKMHRQGEDTWENFINVDTASLKATSRRSHWAKVIQVVHSRKLSSKCCAWMEFSLIYSFELHFIILYKYLESESRIF